MTEMETLARRVEALERQNRRVKLAALGIVLGAMVVALSGAGQATRTVEAQKIVLLDNHGRAKLTIGTPALTGATVGVNPDDAVIWFTDDKGTDRAMLTSDGLFFANRDARPTISISSDPKASELKLYGMDGRVLWSAP
jgi:hypothetical protein